ncbi:uncharacterized protein CEXT_489221 [Caerostris extrusa]|uniref:Uncharacterized protein n=1 Tax=Caerostris extrusa TaxID=172846 RepID=A0AAV4UN94_CAEEX|nr:uncharacterized protein CEXT_489221 [Caerostris extrusa]
MTPDIMNWPRFGFNNVDDLLKNHLTNSRCSHEDIILYFRRKKNSEANEIAQNYFGAESEPWDPKSILATSEPYGMTSTAMNGLEDSKFVTIQDREEFAADRR